MKPADCPKAVLFDLDDTLAPSFESPSPEIVEKLVRLTASLQIGIVTGRDFEWMARDFLPKIEAHVSGNFFVVAESGAQGSRWDGSSWQKLYEHAISDEERARIHAAVEQAVGTTRILEGLPRFGKQFVDRKAAVAFSCMGWDVPKELRYSWDPGNARRRKLREHLAAMLPEYEVLMGGATTVDVTQKGVNKAYGVRVLAKRLAIAPQDMLYVGDSLYPGGNDYVVIETGVRTRQTSGPAETGGIIDDLLATCAGVQPNVNV